MRWSTSVAIVAWVGLCALLADCGHAPADAASSSGSASTPGFPLRVLQQAEQPAGDHETILVDEMDSPGDWLVICDGEDGLPRLLPAAGATEQGLVRWQDGHVSLPSGTALLHRVTLADSKPHSLSALLRGPEARAGEPCRNLLLLNTVSAKGKVLIDAEYPNAYEFMRLAQTLTPELVELREEGEEDVGAAWRQDGAPDAFALARWLGAVSCLPPRGPEKWIVLIAFEDPLEVDRVRLSVAPTLVFGSDASTDLPEATTDSVVQRLRIGGDSRVAAVVPPGRTLSLPLDVPPEAVDILLGTCPDPAAVAALKPGEDGRIRWTVRLQPDDRLLGEIDEIISAGRPAGFTEHVLPWPAGVHGPCVLEFSVLGKAAMVFGQPRVRGPERPDAPSLLLISIDTLRADHVGSYGYARPTTPFLDELAARGARFEDVTAVSSFTLPTHASMFTGLFPLRHLALDTFDRMNAQRTPTLARILSEAGFHTAAFTGGGFLSGDYGFDTGFDRYSTVDPLAVAPGADECRLDEVADWIHRLGQRSWFAFVHTYVLHDYRAEPADLPAFERAPAPEGFDVYALLDQRDVKASPPTEAELGRLVDLYDGALHSVDRRLRLFLEPLRAEGLLANTWIVVTSDHGEEFLEHGQLRHRSTLYEELMRVPLLIVPPESAALPGVRVSDSVSQVDLFATLLELLGRPVPEGLDGRSLAAYVRGGRAGGEPTPLYGHLARSIAARSMLRTGSWKYIQSDTVLEPGREAIELFDLAHDPFERQDLEGSASEPLQALGGRLAAIEAAQRLQGGERTQFQPDDALREQLTQLGYVEAGR